MSHPFGKGLHIYTFENQCRECPSLFLRDETTKVFINAAGTADDVSQEMKDFLDYLQGKGTKSDFTRRIEEEVNRARTHEEWKVEYMSLFMRDQEMREEGREIGRVEGREETCYTVVMNMLKENDSIEKICRVTGCDEAFVKKVQEETA